jgi:hypothetical protein
MNPYARLKNAAKKFVFQCINPLNTFLWRFPKEKIEKGTGFEMATVYYSVLTAERLGYECVIKTTESDELEIVARKKPEVPYELL